jgi:hypothetical protein
VNGNSTVLAASTPTPNRPGSPRSCSVTGANHTDADRIVVADPVDSHGARA